MLKLVTRTGLKLSAVMDNKEYKQMIRLIHYGQIFALLLCVVSTVLIVWGLWKGMHYIIGKLQW